jgi:hypothetical protein
MHRRHATRARIRRCIAATCLPFRSCQVRFPPSHTDGCALHLVQIVTPILLQSNGECTRFACAPVASTALVRRGIVCTTGGSSGDMKAARLAGSQRNGRGRTETDVLGVFASPSALSASRLHASQDCRDVQLSWTPRLCGCNVQTMPSLRRQPGTGDGPLAQCRHLRRPWAARCPRPWSRPLALPRWTRGRS